MYFFFFFVSTLVTILTLINRKDMFLKPCYSCSKSQQIISIKKRELMPCKQPTMKQTMKWNSPWIRKVSTFKSLSFIEFVEWFVQKKTHQTHTNTQLFEMVWKFGGWKESLIIQLEFIDVRWSATIQMENNELKRHTLCRSTLARSLLDSLNIIHCLH